MKLRLKECLAKQHLSFGDVYAQTGIAVSTLSRIANGKQSPSLDMVERIANCIGLPIDELLVMDGQYIECPHCHRLVRVEVTR